MTNVPQEAMGERIRVLLEREIARLTEIAEGRADGYQGEHPATLAQQGVARETAARLRGIVDRSLAPESVEEPEKTGEAQAQCETCGDSRLVKVEYGLDPEGRPTGMYPCPDCKPREGQ